MMHTLSGRSKLVPGDTKSLCSTQMGVVGGESCSICQTWIATQTQCSESSNYAHVHPGWTPTYLYFDLDLPLTFLHITVCYVYSYLLASSSCSYPGYVLSRIPSIPTSEPERGLKAAILLYCGWLIQMYMQNQRDFEKKGLSPSYGVHLWAPEVYIFLISLLCLVLVKIQIPHAECHWWLAFYMANMWVVEVMFVPYT